MPLAKIRFTDPDEVPHTSKLLPGISEQPLARCLAGTSPASIRLSASLFVINEVVNAADMDEGSRLKGFGGEPAACHGMSAE